MSIELVLSNGSDSAFLANLLVVTWLPHWAFSARVKMSVEPDLSARPTRRIGTPSLVQRAATSAEFISEVLLFSAFRAGSFQLVISPLKILQ